MFETRVKIKKMAKKSSELCQKAETKYIPFGLDDLIPDAWECEFDSKYNLKKTE